MAGANRNHPRGRQSKEEKYMDYSLIFIVLFLLGFGLVMVYSTSSYEANLTFRNSTYYLRKQLISTIVGLIVMVAVAMIPYHFWEFFPLIAYGASVFLILMIIPFGHSANGAKRWLYFGPVSFQPAEAAKLGMIVFLAGLICAMGSTVRYAKGFWTVFATPLPIVLMVWKITDNMSSAVIIMGIAILMLFVSTPGYKRFLLIGGTVAVGATAVVLYISNVASKAVDSLGFRGARILAWLDPEAYASGKGFQTLQALYAIGSGGIMGKGLGQSMQKLGFLPEAQNDMIFSIICEELGLFGGISVILMFVLLIWRFMIIANNAPDLYGALLVVGVMGHIAIQVILNIAVVTNTIPNTGISLPFISYGGTSVVFLLMEIGLVISVGRGIKLKDL